ncbi:MAG: hypothetical protein ABL964_09880 [Steroidobacteraceae bacterium]
MTPEQKAKELVTEVRIAWARGVEPRIEPSRAVRIIEALLEAKATPEATGLLSEMLAALREVVAHFDLPRDQYTGPEWGALESAKAAYEHATESQLRGKLVSLIASAEAGAPVEPEVTPRQMACVRCLCVQRRR